SRKSRKPLPDAPPNPHRTFIRANSALLPTSVRSTTAPASAPTMCLQTMPLHLTYVVPRRTPSASRRGARRRHELGPQRLAPVGNGGDLLVLEQDLGLLLHVGLDVRREARIDLDARHRLLEGRLRHLVALV